MLTSLLPSSNLLNATIIHEDIKIFKTLTSRFFVKLHNIGFVKHAIEFFPNIQSFPTSNSLH